MIYFPSETQIWKRKKFWDPFLAPIQIASDLEKIILWPEKLENLIKVARRLSKETLRAIQKTSWIIY